MSRPESRSRLRFSLSHLLFTIAPTPHNQSHTRICAACWRDARCAPHRAVDTPHISRRPRSHHNDISTISHLTQPAPSYQNQKYSRTAPRAAPPPPCLPSATSAEARLARSEKRAQRRSLLCVAVRPSRTAHPPTPVAPSGRSSGRSLQGDSGPRHADGLVGWRVGPGRDVPRVGRIVLPWLGVTADQHRFAVDDDDGVARPAVA